MHALGVCAVALRSVLTSMLPGRYLGLCLLLALATPVQAVTAQRVVSLNLCTDQLLLAMLPRERIAMLSQLSNDAGLSYHARLVGDIPRFDGSVESVLKHQPELILAGRYSASAASRLLSRLGHRVEVFDMPETLAGTRDFVRRVAAMIGTEHRGATLLEEMDQRLQKISQRPAGAAVSALLFLPNGTTPGRGSLKDTLMRVAGLDNMAARLGIEGYGQVSLETLLRHPPGLILLDAAELQAPSLARSLLAHPALDRLTVPVVEIDTSTWICPGPMIAHAVEALSAARATAGGN